MTNSWLVILPAALLAITITLAWFARRGKRIDDHPLCRKCGFDLFGKPEDSVLCPECGRDVTKPKSIRIGNRQPRRRLLAAIVPVMVLSLVAVGIIGYGVAAGTNWNLYKPVWWLLNDAKGKDATTRDAAIAELLRRVDADALGDAMQDVVGAALAHQADKNQLWLPAWGDIMEHSHTRGTLAASDWRTYARTAVFDSLSLTGPGKIRDGDRSIVTVETANSRASNVNFFICVDSIALESWIDRRNDKGGDLRNGYRQEWYPGQQLSCSVYDRIQQGREKLKEGPQTARAAVTISIYESKAQQAPIVRETAHLANDWELLPRTVRYVKDPALAATMSTAVTCIGVTHVDDGYEGKEVTVHLKYSKPPVSVVFDVGVTANGKTWSSERGIYRHAGEDGDEDVKVYLGKILPERVDVVLAPSKNATRDTLEAEVWGEDIVFRGVPIHIVKGATPP